MKIFFYFSTYFEKCHHGCVYGVYFKISLNSYIDDGLCILAENENKLFKSLCMKCKKKIFFKNLILWQIKASVITSINNEIADEVDALEVFKKNEKKNK